MLKKLKIGLDLDGVIIDHTSSRIKKTKELGYDLEPNQTQSDVIKKFVSQKHHREIQKYIYGPVSLEAPIMDGAMKHLKELTRAHDFFIISRRNIDDGGEKMGLEWLGKRGFLNFIPKEDVFFVPHEDKGAKNTIAKKLGLEVYLDDQFKILEEMPDVKSRVFFDQYNVLSVQPPFLKIKKWQELPAIIAGL